MVVPKKRSLSFIMTRQRRYFLVHTDFQESASRQSWPSVISIIFFCLSLWARLVYCTFQNLHVQKKYIVEPKPDLWPFSLFWLSIPLKVTFEPVCKNGFDWKDYMTKQYWRKDTQKTNIDWSSGSMYLANVKVA